MVVVRWLLKDGHDGILIFDQVGLQVANSKDWPSECTFVETIEHEQFVEVIWNSRRVVLLNADVVFIGFRGLMMSKATNKNSLRMI